MTGRILRRAALAAGAILACAASGAGAQDRATAFTGATIHTMAGPVIENGTLVIQDGRIAAVGAKVEQHVRGAARRWGHSRGSWWSS